MRSSRVVRALLVCLLAVLGTIVSATPASAAPGYIAIHNQGDSDAHVDTIMYVPASGVNYETNVYPGQTVGEPNYEQSNAEPVDIYNRAGWCSKWWYNDDLTWIRYAYAQSSGYWINVYPSDTSSGTILIRVKTWNC